VNCNQEIDHIANNIQVTAPTVKQIQVPDSTTSQIQDTDLLLSHNQVIDPKSLTPESTVIRRLTTQLTIFRSQPHNQTDSCPWLFNQINSGH
jgi:hypothetical protein